MVTYNFLESNVMVKSIKKTLLKYKGGNQAPLIN